MIDSCKQHRKIVIFVTGIITVVCLIAFIFCWERRNAGRQRDPHADYKEEMKPWYPEWKKAVKNNTKIILLYTSWFGHRFWWTMKGQQIYRHFTTCEGPKNCILTYDRSWLKKADAVVFHGRDLEVHANTFYSGKVLKSLRKAMPKSQRWIFFAHENPDKDLEIYQKYDGLFNWTATFDRRSDIFVPYSSYEENKRIHSKKTDYAKEKTGLVAWAASHCNLMRDRYVTELQKYISVIVYGKCSKYFKRRGELCTHNKNECTKVLSRYKFYLALENDFCHDYVTEKYWERITQDVVPVVMGANYEKGVAIPGSYIDASKFDSIQKLAEYLLHLDKNDDEYNKYFNFKRRPRKKYTSLFCRICAKLQDVKLENPKQIKLSEVYNYKKNCGIYKEKIEKFEKQIEDSQRKDGFFRSRLWYKIKSLFFKLGG